MPLARYIRAMSVAAAPRPPTVDGFLSLSAVAALADVKRPVVSVWRRRYATTLDPFPAPASRGPDGQEKFAADDVVSWLQRTGLGNNPDAAMEAALFVELDERAAQGRGAVLHALTALLTLKVFTGLPVSRMTPAELLDLADDVDPHDEFLFAELDAVSGELQHWAGRAEALADAAYTPAEALESLLRRHRWLLRPFAETTMSPSLGALAGRTAAALAFPAAHNPVLVDTSGGGALLRDAVALLPDPADATVWVGTGDRRDTAMTRLARRRLVAAGSDVRGLASADGDLDLPAGSMVLTQIPDSATGPMSDGAVVDELDRIALAMRDADRAVVIAPASALTDRSPAAVGRARAEVLRTGRVRAIVRLPAGLWSSRPRQRMAMWVLGEPSAPRVDDRWVAVADLATDRLEEDVIQGVVSDVVAASGDRATARAHAFQFARLVPASALQATTGDLVRTAPPARRPRARSADTAVLIDRLAESAARPLPHVKVDVSHREYAGVRTVTLGDLVDAGAVRIVKGNRIDGSDLAAEGDVPVFGPDDLDHHGTRPARSIDRLAFSATYPYGRYTEPGDVVFRSSPRTAAVVDEDGFGVVLSPARVLRIVPGIEPGITPHLLAAAVRSARGRTPWRSWQVRLAPAGEAAALDAALHGVAEALAALEARRRDLHVLAAALTEGVTAGGLTLNPTTEHDDALSRQRG